MVDAIWKSLVGKILVPPFPSSAAYGTICMNIFVHNHALFKTAHRVGNWELVGLFYDGGTDDGDGSALVL